MRQRYLWGRFFCSSNAEKVRFSGKSLRFFPPRRLKNLITGTSRPHSAPERVETAIARAFRPWKRRIYGQNAVASAFRILKRLIRGETAIAFRKLGPRFSNETGHTVYQKAGEKIKAWLKGVKLMLWATLFSESPSSGYLQRHLAVSPVA